MKKFMYIILLRQLIEKSCLFFIVFSLFSCGNNEHKLLSLFPSLENAVLMEKSIDMDSIRDPYLMKCVSGKLCFANLRFEKMISMFDIESGKFIGDFISRGMGPDDLIFISNLCKTDNRLSVFDADKKEMRFYDINGDSIREVTKSLLQYHPEHLISAFNAICLNEDCLAATGVVKSGRITLEDSCGNVIAVFGDYPDEKNKTDVEKGFAYQGFMAYSIENKVLSIGSAFGESIAFYDLSDKNNPVLLKEYIYAYPSYRLFDNDVIWEKDNIFGVIGIESSPSYCIVLYRGEPQSGNEYGGDKLLFFDWLGNPVRAMQLDQIYTNLAYDETHNELWLLGSDKQTHGYKLVSVAM